MPQLVEASTNQSFLLLGRDPKIQLNEMPELAKSIDLQMRSAVRLYCVSCCLVDGIPREIWTVIAERKGRPQGSTYAAHTKFPTNFSHSLEDISFADRTAFILQVYLLIFFAGNEQRLFTAS